MFIEVFTKLQSVNFIKPGLEMLLYEKIAFNYRTAETARFVNFIKSGLSEVFM